jgi:putative SOS response-associated peptidase YedK
MEKRSQLSGYVVSNACSISNELMQPIHDHMPVLLDRDQWGVWLSQGVKQADLLLPMVRPHQPESMQAWSVSRELNRVGVRDDAGLIEHV